MTDAPAGRRLGRGKVIPFDQPSPAFSDDALALRFADLHAHDAALRREMVRVATMGWFALAA